MVNVVRKMQSMQYTGTNGQDIADWLTGMSVVSDEDGTLVFGAGDGPEAERYQITTDSWVVRDAGSRMLVTYCTPQEYESGWLAVGAN